jgi:hypothetical protein
LCNMRLIHAVGKQQLLDVREEEVRTTTILCLLKPAEHKVESYSHACTVVVHKTCRAYVAYCSS